ncbi:MAG: bifunctional phosphopantothenoylcysteine decarboxylase/phosphopantothenate--cysteine ligase CoaBC [Myxococcota bacterium]|nr:bifunctional phosphopantothenoylcysteine decarboxylase/phosphopantothenate--cysteine ligase CoaBC [Myxococcota bacterium]
MTTRAGAHFPTRLALQGRRVLVCVGGGIAAYKALELVRELKRRGASVRVAMTPAAERFVAPLSFAALSGEPVARDLWSDAHRGEIHVELGAWAEAVVVAPATANLLVRAASGLCDDVVLATLACCRAPTLFAPAMHERMWRHAPVARAVRRLRDDGARLVGPVTGPLASGEVGEGRMSEPSEIADAVERILASTGADLEGVRVLVTSGPTLEDLDPVRFLGNRSTGRMGHALARRALARGAHVTLISGPVALEPPPGAEHVAVRSALQMHEAVLARADAQDAIVMAAAVADWRPAEPSTDKLKKPDGVTETTLRLVRNPDILAELGAWRAARGQRRPVLVGFAVETRDLEQAAREKLRVKRCDLVVANLAADGFGGDEDVALLVDEDGVASTGRIDKHALADLVLDRVRARLASG